MKILVYDVAAEDGGGLFVLKNFYEEVIKDSEKHPNIEWIFLTSYKILESKKNVHTINYAWIKKSWIHRLYFEEIKIQKILRELDVDVIISLQNTIIKHCKIRQYVYLHQSLQYCPQKFSLLNRTERGLAIRQKFICGMYKNGIKKATHIYVQTEWIKDETIKWISCKKDKISVIPVSIEKIPEQYDKKELKTNVFFYPARAEIYKNHDVILKACKILEKRGVYNYRVLFTMEKTDNLYAQHISNECEKLPIEFIGKVEYKDIWNYYKKAVLLFPSYLETCGLPMLEARYMETIVLASDLPFAHEALDGYKNAYFFQYSDENKLADIMEELIKGQKKYIYVEKQEMKTNKSSLLKSMMNDILNKDR